MSRTEELRDDPSAGKSGASPSESGSGRKSLTVFADPDTDTRYDPARVPQASPVPDVQRDLEEARKPRPGRGPVARKDEDESI
jgi:hypothetical protein